MTNISLVQAPANKIEKLKHRETKQKQCRWMKMHTKKQMQATTKGGQAELELMSLTSRGRRKNFIHTSHIFRKPTACEARQSARERVRAGTKNVPGSERDANCSYMIGCWVRDSLHRLTAWRKISIKRIKFRSRCKCPLSRQCHLRCFFYDLNRHSRSCLKFIQSDFPVWMFPHLLWNEHGFHITWTEGQRTVNLKFNVW